MGSVEPGKTRSNTGMKCRRMSLKASRKVISWLKTLDGRSPTVHLTWETPGHLTLSHWDSGTAQATIRVPVGRSEGGEGGECQPPAISFSPRYLAAAPTIGPVLRLIDGMSPGVATDSPATAPTPAR